MQKVAENGKEMSVFGLMHNDHVCLEMQNEKDKSWFRGKNGGMKK